ncbi:eukaryotic translation initiation factor 3 subunit K-like [Teleopsis dalmanni]|uniref:eukaryotic translation initiation factor 3 subunit K-like n=1 Tax=Teleopsis dalmanni TaxID=139649 RepID=UPI0018CE044F|nr:eukaryotic translation initiation factor 3 subunit K-like [Teleopsis dalmanni]XP_037961230.1 eukaryotic translation initiation factor 3 subunit K-like [Teleopsis dalmanni]
MALIRAAIPKEGLERYEKYRPENLTFFEQLIREQTGNKYCFKLNMHVLRMYNAYPKLINLELTRIVLLRALTKLPYKHFVSAKKYLIWPQFIDDGIRVIIDLANFLEQEEYAKFWVHCKQNVSVISMVEGFEEVIRKYICFMVGANRRTILCSQLIVKLNIDEENLEKYVSQFGWTINGREVKVFPLMLNDAKFYNVIRGVKPDL